MGLLGIGAVVVAVLAVGVLLAQLAWNTFMPAVFGLPTIDFGETLAGLYLLWLLKGVGPNFSTKKD